MDESVLPAASIDEAIDLTLSEYGVAGPAYRASMLVDFLAERPMEIEVIIGGILRYAATKQVPTPRSAISAFTHWLIVSPKFLPLDSAQLMRYSRCTKPDLFRRVKVGHRVILIMKAPECLDT